MISYEDLNRLKDSQFEKLIKTLLLNVIGKGVTPFSHGKDGAREATFTGKAEYPSKIDNWDGNWIFQVKFSDMTLGIDKARNQIKYTINSELRKLEDYGYLSSNKCENYIYITNVPFSGESEKGLHDYIADKRKTYKVKNFHYWDGEKIITLLNNNSEVRSTFFPINGINAIDDATFKEVKEYFVKPGKYDALKRSLIDKKIVNIVGQPHVGKTCMATYLAAEVLEEKHLTNVFIIPLIDSLNSIPQIKNSVIIFDDLYGDVNYESIGRKTKIVNSLIKHNFIIVTSREYIFRDAEKNMETVQPDTIDLTINQEGAYSDQELELILKNHLKINLPYSAQNKHAFDFIISYSYLIIGQLRYPHNIQLFTTLVDNSIINKRVLDEKIAKAKKIDDLVQSWIKPQISINKNVLLALSIGKVHTIELLNSICQTQWNYIDEEIKNCIQENIRIVTNDNGIIRFVHPSFKTAIINFFIPTDKNAIIKLIINLITHPYYKEKRAINRSLAYGIIGDLAKEQLIELIHNVHLTKNYIEIVWYNLIKNEKKEAIEQIIKIKPDEKRYSKHFGSFVAAKDYMKDKEIFEFVEYLLSRRKESKVIESLIVHFCFRIRNKVRNIIEQLDAKNNSKDLKLKIKLLGVIGSKDAQAVIPELQAELRSNFVSTRSIVYTAFRMLSNTYDSKIIDILEAALKNEPHENNRLKIQKSINDMKRLKNNAATSS